MNYSACTLRTFVALLSMASGCSEPTQPEIVPTPPTPVVPVNTAPKAFAGRHVWVPSPANSSALEGTAIDAESNIESYSWKKVSGPDSFSIENPQSQQTRVVNLEQGIYEFELTVRDKGGLIGEDIVRVHVYDPRTAFTKEVIFGRLWVCPMGCTVSVENFRAYVPTGTPIRVFLDRGDAAGWIEVIDKWILGDKYVYGISNNTFWVYADNEDGAVDVKITF